VRNQDSGCCLEAAVAFRNSRSRDLSPFLVEPSLALNLSEGAKSLAASAANFGTGNRMLCVTIAIVACPLLWFLGMYIGHDSAAGVPLVGLGVVSLGIVNWMALSGRLSKTRVVPLPRLMILYTWLCLGLALYFPNKAFHLEQAAWNGGVHQLLGFFQYMYA